jgi:hypothetical protein
MMFEMFKNRFKSCFVLVLLMLGTLLWQQAPAQASSTSRAVSYVNYNCEDFGTRERAQSEFNKHRTDRFGLDRDGDGQVCEWNPSAGKWGWFAAAMGLLIGRFAGKRNRFGAEGVVPFPKGMFFDWATDREGKRTAEFEEGTLIMAFFWWVPYFGMTILRDRVFPIDTAPPLLVATAFALGFGITYWVASSKDNWI